MEALSFVFADRHTVPGFIGKDAQKEVCNHLRDLTPDKILLVTEERVNELYGSYFDPLLEENIGETGAATEFDCKLEKMILPSGDAAKSWDHLSRLVEWNFQVGATKKSLVVAFGGGALLNVAGLFASIAYRGMKVVYIPTTFLAMHDVVTSLKTSICYDGRKNNIGSFYAPVKILIDVDFCASLPRNELFSGLGELAKNAALFGGRHAETFQRALSNKAVNDMNGGSGEEFSLSDDTLMELTRLGIEAKMSLLAVDAYERTSGMVFEYGHTLSHAIEKAYGDGTVPHGIGVCYGMLSTSFAAEKMGVMTKSDREAHDEVCNLLVSRWPLPDPKPSVQRVMSLAMKDSKRGITSEEDHEISDVLVRKIGDVVTTKTNNLSRFPAKYVEEWLQLQGFPCETDSIDAASAALVAKMNMASDEELKSSGIELLVAGFANRVCATELCGQRVVSKRYTDLVFLRIDRDAIGAVDEHAGAHGAGPKILHSSEQGLVMDRLSGRELEEADMHKCDHELLDCVAEALAKFHQLPVPTACEGEPMLWRTIDKMMQVVARKPELVPEGVPCVQALFAEIAAARKALEVYDPKVVLGHGDCKPSNVMLTQEKPYAVSLIDFELGGPNYRGFDLFKIFRTALPFSDDSLSHFLRSYVAATGDNMPPAKMLAEVRRFEPLTWLEASIFFLAMLEFKPAEASRWRTLAVDRWEKYTSTRGKLIG